MHLLVLLHNDRLCCGQHRRPELLQAGGHPRAKVELHAAKEDGALLEGVSKWRGKREVLNQVHPLHLIKPHLLISRDGVRDDAEAGGQEVGVTVTDQPTGLAAVDDPEVRVDGNAGGQRLREKRCG